MAPMRELSGEELAAVRQMEKIGAIIWERLPDEKNPNISRVAVRGWCKNPSMDMLRERIAWLKRNPQPKE